MSLDEKTELSKIDSKRESSGNLSNGGLLADIKEISENLDLHKTPPKDLYPPFSNHQSMSLRKNSLSTPKSRTTLEDLLCKNKRPSFWNWKPIKALTHMRNQRFNSCFFLHVHSIEGLSSKFNDLTLCVNWKKKNEVWKTRPSRVLNGIVEFEETLMHHCSVYGKKSGPDNSMKYEPKLFCLNASVIGSPKLDIGNQWVDLTRLLPLTLEELDEEKMTSGKWRTSFNLTGKAKDAVLNVTFGFSLTCGKSMEPHCFMQVPENSRGSEMKLEDCDGISTNDMFFRLVGVPRNSRRTQSMDFRNGRSEFGQRMSFLNQTLEEKKLSDSNDLNEDTELLKSKSEDLVQPIGEESMKEDKKVEKDADSSSDRVETIDIDEIFKDMETNSDEVKDEDDRLDINEEKLVKQKSLEKRSSFKSGMVRSLSLDALTESVANEFLSMLGTEDENSDNGSESPRERLLREFVEESLASGNSIYDFKTTEKEEEEEDVCSLDLDLSLDFQALTRKRNEILLDIIETENLMEECDLDNDSSCISYGGFGSPFHLLSPS